MEQRKDSDQAPTITPLEQKEEENLMLRRISMKSKEREEGHWLRSLCRTKCKVGERCCNLVIDGGNIHSIVSAEMGKRLSLKYTRQFRPYKESSLQKGHDVTMNEK
jgi:hypothetical protein